MKRDEEPPTEDKGNDRLTNEQRRLIEDYVRELRSMIEKLRKPCSEAVVASCGSINFSPRQAPARRSADRSRIGSPVGGLREPFPSSAQGFENFVNAHRSHQPIRRAQDRAGCDGGRVVCP
jgi:hypothetical protein